MFEIPQECSPTRNVLNFSNLLFCLRYENVISECFGILINYADHGVLQLLFNQPTFRTLCYLLLEVLTTRR